MDKILPNTEAFEREIWISESGFREYDARWLYPEQINLRGLQALGMAIGHIIHERGLRPDVVVGHDYRSYSASVKQAVIIGLMNAGCRVHDIGLALSPVAYYTQFALDCPAVAMVTASHNENGWTGVKMGVERPLTFGPDEMSRLKDLALSGGYETREGGSYTYIPDIRTSYMDDLTKDGPLRRKLRVVTACGNGTAGVYAPDALEKIGCEVIRMDCDLDHSFPNYNPNPEDLEMLHALRDKVVECGADIGFAFDGDGDRCGVVDNTGREIFADKVGVMVARYAAKTYDRKQFVVDVKSTGLYKTDPVLKELGAETDYWKTGHSYIKRRVNALNALIGFEKSGHYFFNAPIGRGYDDGILSAITVCRMMDADEGGRTLAEIYDDLPITYGSPTMSPYCPDEVKYEIVDQFTIRVVEKKEKGETLLGRKIVDVITVNGARVVLEDGTWGLVRASSNKPGLVVVVESPVSEDSMKGMFREIDGILSSYPDVGEYDQKIEL